MTTNARIIRWSGAFSQVGDMPTLTIPSTPSLPGASYDWTAETLTPGQVAHWSDQVSGAILQADGTAPTLKEVGGFKTLAFDGKTSRMRVFLPVDGPHTIATVFRFTDTAARNIVHYGTGGSGAGWVALSSTGSNVSAGGLGVSIPQNPELAPDTDWHIAILSLGQNTAFRYDTYETAGTLSGLVKRDGLTLGYGQGNSRTPIEYRRIAIIPGEMDSTQRGALYQHLKRTHVGA